MSDWVEGMAGGGHFFEIRLLMKSATLKRVNSLARKQFTFCTFNDKEAAREQAEPGPEATEFETAEE